jgi:hypothetical protein
MKIIFFLIDLICLPFTYLAMIYLFLVRSLGGVKLKMCNRMMVKEGVYQGY